MSRTQFRRWRPVLWEFCRSSVLLPSILTFSAVALYFRRICELPVIADLFPPTLLTVSPRYLGCGNPLIEIFPIFRFPILCLSSDISYTQFGRIYNNTHICPLFLYFAINLNQSWFSSGDKSNGIHVCANLRRLIEDSSPLVKIRDWNPVIQGSHCFFQSRYSGLIIRDPAVLGDFLTTLL